MRIAVVTDSTCDVPQALLTEKGLFMVPLSVFFGDEEFQDGLDLTPEVFFTTLRSRAETPTTSQPSPGKFLQLYQQLQASGYDHILSLHLSAHLSGTVQAATVASRLVKDIGVTVIDSKTTTWGLGLLAFYVLDLIREGLPLETLVIRIQEQIPRMMIYFSVDSLTGLQRGGRIGKAAALVGGALGIRPMLRLAGTSGEVEVEKVAASHASMTRMLVETAVRRAAEVPPIYGVVVLSGDKADWQQELLAGLKRKGFQAPRILTGSIGAVIGSHLGDSAAGIVLC